MQREASKGTSGLSLSARSENSHLRTYLSLEVAVYETDGNSRLAYTSTAHDDEMVRAGSTRIVIFGSTVTAEIVVVRVLVTALGTLRHLGLMMRSFAGDTNGGVERRDVRCKLTLSGIGAPGRIWKTAILSLCGTYYG